MITPIPTAINKYQIIKPLGAGNFGQVFHVFDREKKKDRVIMIFAKECQTWGSTLVRNLKQI